MVALALVCRAAFFTLSATCAWTPAALAEPPRAARADDGCANLTSPFGIEGHEHQIAHASDSGRNERSRDQTHARVRQARVRRAGARVAPRGRLQGVAPGDALYMAALFGHKPPRPNSAPELCGEMLQWLATRP